MTAQKPEDGGAYVQFINKDKEREKKEEEEKEKREEEEKVQLSLSPTIRFWSKGKLMSIRLVSR